MATPECSRCVSLGHGNSRYGYLDRIVLFGGEDKGFGVATPAAVSYAEKRELWTGVRAQEVVHGHPFVIRRLLSPVA